MNTAVHPSTPAQALPILAACEPFALRGESAAQLAQGSALHTIEQDGVPVAAFAVDVLTNAQGDREIYVSAAAGKGRDLVGTISRFAEHEARRIGAKRISCDTRRPGLVRRLRRAGFAVSYTLTKEL